jgi:streptogramin lyase
VRSHAKASSAGSTQGQGSRSGSSVRGADATHALSLGVDESGVPSRGPIAAALALAIATLALLTFAQCAPAGFTRVPLGFSPITGSGSGVTIHTPSGIAVDETSGNVFLNDGSGGNVVDILGAEGGAPLGLVSPFTLSGFVFASEPSGAAVDNATGSAGKGALYVTDVVHSVVKKFTRNPGTELYEAAGELTPTVGPLFSEPLGVTVDTHGNIFVADYGSLSVVEFSPTGTQLKRIAVFPSLGTSPSSIAVDAAGDLFAEGYSGGAVYKYPANGSGEIELSGGEGTAPVNSTLVVGSGASGIAVDPATNRLFISFGTHVSEYNATSLAKTADFGVGALGGATRVAVNSATNRVYVADRGVGKKNVAVFGALVIAPDLSVGAANGVSGTAATLNGAVNPSNVAVTDCHFEWGTSTAYGHSAPCSGPIPTDGSDHPISAAISGLTPNGATYHFRLSATNANGTFTSGDETLSTADAVISEAAGGITPSSATLHGSVNPEGSAVTDCHFEYTTEAAWQANAFSGATHFPCSPSPGSGSSPVSVSGSISGLEVLTPYKFRLVASNAAGTVSGATLAFSTTGPVARNLISSFGSDGTSSSSFIAPDHLAFDQSLRRLYVLDRGFQKIYAFTTSPSFGLAGSPFPLSVPPTGNVPDIVADSPSHNLYYQSGEQQSIYGFDSAGADLGAPFPISPPEPRDLRGVAVDPSGNIWAADFYAEKVREYDPTTGNEIDSVETASMTDFSERPTQPVFDSNGDMFLVVLFSGDVYKLTAASGYDPAQATQVTQPVGSAIQAIALDGSAHVLYLAHPEYVSAYGTDGTHLYDFGKDIEEPYYTGVTVDQNTDRIYVSDRNRQEVHVFGTPVAVPIVTTGAAEKGTTGGVTLTGSVNPAASTITGCYFEYATEADFQENGFATALHAPCRPTSFGTGTTNVAVSSSPLRGLPASTDYRFRLVATTANGNIVQGEPEAFSTLGPQIHDSEVVWGSITPTQTTLTAKINPHGEGTSYRVEYVSKADFDQSGYTVAKTAPAGIAGAGNGSSDVNVSVTLSDLQPAGQYRARFVAVNPSGTATGTTLAFGTYSAQGVSGGCGNEEFRSGPSASVPDCRAYEQTSPVDKDGSDTEITRYGGEASSKGGAVTFAVRSPIPGSDFYSSFVVAYISRRVDGSWLTRGLAPPSTYGARGQVNGWSGDLGTALTYSTFIDLPGMPAARHNFLRDTDDNSLTAIAPPVEVPAAVLSGTSADNSKVLVETSGGVLPVDIGPAPTSIEDNLYLYNRDTSQLGLAGILPDSACGSPPCIPVEGSFAGSYDWLEGNLSRGGMVGRYATRDQHVISDSGDKVFFTTAGDGHLYMREGLNGATPGTVQVNVSSDGTVDPNGPKPAAFLGATPSGSRVFFASCQKLTADSTAVSTSANTCTSENQGQDLYAFDSETHEVKDLTVDLGDPKGADVRGMIGASEDGEYVYFVANGDLDGGAEPGNCHSLDAFAGPGHCSLYLSHDGSITFIGSLGIRDGGNWNPAGASFVPEPAFGHVSSNGHTILFHSSQIDADVTRLYRYNVDSGLNCISCNPAGDPYEDFALRAGDTSNHTGTNLNDLKNIPYVTRNLSSSGGRVFFQTSAKLVPADTNGDHSCPVGQHDIGNGPACEDVYEWEAPGVGACVEGGRSYSPANAGCLYLLSAGTGPFPSYLIDASASGDDVFILTRDRLVPQDRDDLQDSYDVRVDGGLASQHSISLPSCEAEGCRGAASAAPPATGAGTASFAGSGNPKPNHQSHKQKKHKRKRHNHKSSHRRTANNHRRAAR